MRSALYRGSIRYHRFEPVEHAFRGPLFKLYLDLGGSESRSSPIPEVCDVRTRRPLADGAPSIRPRWS
jgi:hypothetical protein